MEWNLRPARDMGSPTRKRLASPLRERSLGGLAINGAWRRLTRAYLAAMHRLRVTGRENLPAKGPFVMVANHASHLDALTLTSVLHGASGRQVYALAAADTFFTGVASSAFAAYAINALPVTRQGGGTGGGRAGMRAMRERLIEDGFVFVIFPEGTRTRTGALAPFRAGIGMLVAGTDIPVVPCWIHGAFEAWPATRKFPWSLPLALSIGPALRFARATDDVTGWNAVAAECEKAVRGLGDTFKASESSPTNQRKSEAPKD
jgi:1-acyl-sn-glycerol-3-phosphate acyltransferase